MKTDIKNEWIAALRSDEYKQGIRRLKQRLADGETKYSCMGVLCDIFVKHTGERWVPSGDSTDPYEDIDGWFNILPPRVGRFAGLDGHVGLYGTKFYFGSRLAELCHMNDSGASFSAIAEKIEAEF